MSQVQPDDPVRMRRAIAALPGLTRRVYLLHLADGLDYGAIAAGLELTVAEVQDRIAQAIVLIDRHLRAGEP